MGKWMTDAIFISGLSAVGYLISLASEAGYCYFFGIPLDWISVSPNVVLRTIWPLGVTLLPVILLLNVISPFLRRMSRFLREWLMTALFFLACATVVLNWTIMLSDWRVFFIVLGIVLFLAAIVTFDMSVFWTPDSKGI
jgi:hypothetical protein